jgi:F-type H+-transporting ATPase subunit a
MEQHVSWITQVVNHFLGGVALALLSALHIKPNHPDMPIPEHVCMGLLVLVAGTLLALLVRSRLSVERPGTAQQVAELLLTNKEGFGINDIVSENAGHHWREYVPLVGTISLFILLANLFGVFPGFTSPTAEVSVPLACAIIVFCYFNWQGIRHHGLGHYLLMFAGSPKDIGSWFLALLLFPVEIISTCARLLSLTVRLWANIFASDLIYALFLGLFAAPALWGWTKHPAIGFVLGVLPALIPIAFIVLHIFVSVVQAYVFTILPAVYIGLATADEH